MITIRFAVDLSLAELAEALAEGEHPFGADATFAGNALVQWAGPDCPWFVPGPCPVDLTAAHAPEET